MIRSTQTITSSITKRNPRLLLLRLGLLLSAILLFSVTGRTQTNLDYYNIQFPFSANIPVGGSITVYAQVYSSGLTEAGGAAPGVSCWIGYSSSNVDPSDPSFTWVAASYNVQAGNNDEYQASIGSTLPAGTYYYASRWQRNGGTFYYGGTQGSWGGSSISGVLTVTGGPLTNLDYYNLQFPSTANIQTGGSVNVYAQVYSSGLTEAGGAAPGVSCWIGYSSSNVDPSDPSFTWVAASYNSQAGNNDEYVASIGSSLPAGTYYYASRFQRNGGSYYYGGTQGAWGGSSISGVLTINAVAPDFDYYNIQFPLTATIQVGGSTTVYAQVYKTGLTEAAGAPAGVSSWIGYSSSNVNPSDPSFTWVPATYNVQAGSNDEFQATIGSTLPAGTYYYASRWQLNAGSYYYGGTQGAWGGASISGVLTVNPVSNTLSYYNIQFPYTASITVGGSTTVYAQVYEGGVTEAGGADAGVSAWIGYGSNNVDPSDPSFTWVPASYNTQAGNNDEYQAAIGSNLPVGTYYYASRFQRNGGVYYYGGTQGAWGGSSISGVLTVNCATPATPTITPGGPTAFCANGSVILTSSAASGNQWYKDNVLLNGETGTTYTATTAGSYVVTASSGNCVSLASDPVVVSINPSILAAPVVTGIVNVCPYIGTGDPVTYTFNSPTATLYNYTLPPNVSLVSSTVNSITVNFLAGFASQANKQIKVTASSACGSSPQTIYYLLAQAPGTPAPITGNNNVCPIIGTAATYTYSIAPVTGATSYTWIAQAGTTTITHPNGTGINDYTVEVSFTNAFTTSAITVQAVNGCGISNARSITVSKTIPSTPAPISGPTNACAYISPGGTTAFYSTNAVTPGLTYNWTVPAGAIGFTGQGTSSISFVYPAGFTTGTVSVTATNGCGSSGARSLSISKLSPSAPSIIDVIQVDVCPSRQFTYSISSLPLNAASVVWTIPAGATLVSGQGTTSITVSYPPTSVNGNVTVQAISNCGNSSIRTTPVKLPVCAVAPPPPPFAKGNQQVQLQSGDLEVSVYPNPTVNDCKLEIKTVAKEKINIRITDIQGRLFKRYTIAPGQIINPASGLTAGSYIVEVKQGNNTRTTRFVKF